MTGGAGCAWPGGACVAGGHAWQGEGGMHGGGVCGRGACVTCMPCPPGQILQLWHTVNERAVPILLECILVKDEVPIKRA